MRLGLGFRTGHLLRRTRKSAWRNCCADILEQNLAVRGKTRPHALGIQFFNANVLILFCSNDVQMSRGCGWMSRCSFHGDSVMSSCFADVSAGIAMMFR